jgi:hypothetical protein
MAEVVLWNHADPHEGVVKTRSWGYCTSETCAHWSHDPYFEYYVTVVDGEVVWTGEVGDELVVSNKSGRVWYTRYSSNGHYAPTMYTIEIQPESAMINEELIKRLSVYPKRHEALMSFWEAIKQLRHERTAHRRVANE